MEQLALEATCKQVEEEKVMRSSQHGFTEGKSYPTSLVAFWVVIAGWGDEGRAAGAVCLDFSTVSHNILEKELRNAWDR